VVFLANLVGLATVAHKVIILAAAPVSFFSVLEAGGMIVLANIVIAIAHAVCLNHTGPIILAAIIVVFLANLVGLATVAHKVIILAAAPVSFFSVLGTCGMIFIIVVTATVTQIVLVHVARLLNTGWIVVAAFIRVLEANLEGLAVLANIVASTAPRAGVTRATSVGVSGDG